MLPRRIPVDRHTGRHERALAVSAQEQVSQRLAAKERRPPLTAVFGPIVHQMAVLAKRSPMRILIACK
jgi:hypothetical protein